MNDILQYNGYFATIHFSAEDEVFFGKILGINDLVTFEGDSVKEIKVAFEEAVEDYLTTCKDLGKAPDKTYKGSFNVRVPSVLHREAAMVAAANNITLNELVKTALDLIVKNKEMISERISRTGDNDTIFA